MIIAQSVSEGRRHLEAAMGRMGPRICAGAGDWRALRVIALGPGSLPFRATSAQPRSNSRVDSNRVREKRSPNSARTAHRSARAGEGLENRSWRGFGRVLGRARESFAPLKGVTFCDIIEAR